MPPVLLNPYRFGGGAASSAYDAAVLADSPVLFLPFGEASGATVAVDTSGNGHDGVYDLSPVLGATGLVTGDPATAMQTGDTSGSVARVNSAAWMNLTAITVEIVCKLTGVVDGANGDAIASRYTSAGGFNWLLWRNTAGRWAVQARNTAGTTYNVADSSATVVNGNKYHLAFCFDSTSLDLYVGGAVPSGGTVATTGTLQTGTSPIEVPRYSQASTTEPAGTFQKFAIYSGRLSATRIAAHAALV